MRWSVVVISFFLLACVAQGAVIHGSIYDLSLEKIPGVVVEIDSQPMQRFVSTNGTYRFEVPQGQYVLTTRYVDSSMKAQENISVVDDGTYLLDLFLYPELDDTVFEDLDFEIDRPYQPGLLESLQVGWIVSFIILIVSVLYLMLRKKSTHAPIIVKILREAGGEMSQKELRKKLPHGEAKVSLMLSELEKKGRIKKIRRGRTNTIQLVS